jgi:hypothetical protein
MQKAGDGQDRRVQIAHVHDRRQPCLAPLVLPFAIFVPSRLN